MDPIVVDVQLTPEDAVLARRLDRSRNTWVGRNATAAFVVVLFVHGLAIVAILATRSALLIPLGSLLLLTNWLIICYRVWIRTVARRAFRNDPNLQRPFRLEVSDFGVQSSSLAAPGTQRWAEVERWAHGELHYLIYGPGGYHVVPKRFMSDTTALAEVLRERVGPPV